MRWDIIWAFRKLWKVSTVIIIHFSWAECRIESIDLTARGSEWGDWSGNRLISMIIRTGGDSTIFDLYFTAISRDDKWAKCKSRTSWTAEEICRISKFSDWHESTLSSFSLTRYFIIHRSIVILYKLPRLPVSLVGGAIAHVAKKRVYEGNFDKLTAFCKYL